MPTQEVHLKIRIKLSSGKRTYAEPVLASNGKLKRHFALVQGKPHHHPEGFTVCVISRQARGSGGSLALIPNSR